LSHGHTVWSERASETHFYAAQRWAELNELTNARTDYAAERVERFSELCFELFPDGSVEVHTHLDLYSQQLLDGLAGRSNSARCESGWTGDRCTKPLFHRGPHSNE
jgi:hypothetical protein